MDERDIPTIDHQFDDTHRLFRRQRRQNIAGADQGRSRCCIDRLNAALARGPDELRRLTVQRHVHAIQLGPCFRELSPVIGDLDLGGFIVAPGNQTFGQQLLRTADIDLCHGHGLLRGCDLGLYLRPFGSQSA